MLTFSTGPVTIVDYEAGKTREGGEEKGMFWGAAQGGGPVEFVRVAVDGEDELRQFTLDPSLNGQRAEAGQVVQLLLESHIKVEARQSQRTGRPYVARLRKDRVVGMKAVRA